LTPVIDLLRDLKETHLPLGSCDTEYHAKLLSNGGYDCLQDLVGAPAYRWHELLQYCPIFSASCRALAHRLLAKGHELEWGNPKFAHRVQRPGDVPRLMLLSKAALSKTADAI
jgi:hypothetical protein